MGIALGNISVNNMKRNFSVDILSKLKKIESESEDEDNNDK